MASAPPDLLGRSRRILNADGTSLAAILGAAAGGLALAGAAYAAYMAYGARLGADEIMSPAPTQPPESPEAYGLAFEEVRLTTADGLSLGAWFVPAAEPTDRAIALFHGHSASRSQLLPYAKFLAAEFNCLLVDFRASGDSEGAFSSMGYFEATDVLAAVAHLKARGMGRIGAWGMSMGGAAAIRAAAEEPDILAVVTDGTFDRVEHVVAKRAAERRYPLPRVLAKAVVREVERRLGISYAGGQPADVVGRLSPRPVLVVHGTADTTSVVANGHRLYRAAGYPKAIFVVAGAGHTACREVAPMEYERRVAGFFRRHLDGPT